MNIDINIKTNNDELENSPILSHLEGRNSFGVPVGYFDDLEKEILSKVAKEKTIGKTKSIATKILYVAAAASVVIVLGFLAIYFYSLDNNISKHKSPVVNNHFIRHDKLDKLSHYKDDVVKNSLPLNENDSSIKPVKSKKARIEENAPNRVLITNNVNKQTNTTINEDKEVQNSDFDETFNQNIENNSNSIAFVSSQNNNLYRSIVKTRKGNLKSLNTFLPKDTCVNSNFVYDITKIIKSNPRWNFQWLGEKPGENCPIEKSNTYVLHFWLNDSISFYDSMVVSIVEKPQPKISGPSQVCNHKAVLLEAGMKGDEYNYQWSISEENNSEIYIENLKPGKQLIKLIVTSCVDTVETTFLLNVINCNIEVPNVITPNGDGYNDAFVIKGLGKYPGSSLTIIDRNGKVIYQSLNYKNNWKAEGLSEGTYFYSLKINDDNNTEKSGIINIVK